MFLLNQMSENVDLQREGLNEINGKMFYRDKYANWFQKGASGYESAFLKDIIDPDLKANIMNEIQGSSEAKLSLQHENRWYTIWQNMEDGMQSNVNRKAMHSDKTDAQNTYDVTQDTKEGAKAAAPSTQNKFSGSSGNYKTGDKKAFYYKNHDFVRLDDWKLKNKENYNIKILPPTQMDPNNYLIKDASGQNMWVWIAEKVEMG